MTVRRNFTIYQGATWELDVTHLDSDESTSVPASSVSEARLQVRETVGSATTLLDIDSAAKGGITVKDGLIEVRVNDSITSALDFSEGVYDLEVEYSDGAVSRLLMGRVTLSKEVTR